MLDVLVVDDSPLARTILRRCITIAGPEGSSFREAGDGEAAIQALREKKADVVFVDLNMPRMDGEKMLIAVRADPALASVPVIICSSLVSAAHEARLLGLGAHAVLRKPISPAAITALGPGFGLPKGGK